MKKQANDWTQHFVKTVSHGGRLFRCKDSNCNDISYIEDRDGYEVMTARTINEAKLIDAWERSFNKA